MPIMQHISRMLSITMPKRTELSSRRVLSRIESLFLVTTLTAGANAGGVSTFGPTSVSVVAILDFRVDQTITQYNHANSNKRRFHVSTKGYFKLSTSEPELIS